jgi:predicted metal-dependent hydrolase
MSTDRSRIDVSGIAVEVVRKEIKNLHVGVYPPDGRVRVAAPLRVDDENVRLAVVDKLGWIRRKRNELRSQSRQSKREMVTGESHYVLGRRLLLKVVEKEERPDVRQVNNQTLELRVRPGTDAEGRERVLYRWYRYLLRRHVPDLIGEWEARIGVSVADWGIRRRRSDRSPASSTFSSTRWCTSSSVSTTSGWWPLWSRSCRHGGSDATNSTAVRWHTRTGTTE